jgi:DNA-binding SARP family transcriptional activator/tetratricopeptide (TPR) repeat protein
MYRLVTFGGLSVRGGSSSNVATRSRSRLALVAVIAACGERGIRREKLTALFWPDSDDERARNALRQALFALRREFGGEEFTVGTTELTLDPAVVTSDVGEFEAAIRSGRLEDAAAMYSGPFLDGVVARDAPEVERWADERRNRLSHEYARLLERLASAAAADAHPVDASRWWARAVAHDPLSARVARAYMEALAAAGDREAALRHGALHARLVRATLNAEPDQAVSDLTERLRQAAPSAVETDVRTTTTGPLAAPSSVDRVSSALAATTRLEAHIPAHPVETSLRGSADTVPPGGRRSMPRKALLVAAVVGVSTVAAVALFPRRQPDRQLAVLDRRRVIVADFENRTGDSTFDLLGATLADWVTQGVIQAGLTSVVDPQSRMAVQRAARDSTSRAQREPGEAVALAAAAGTVVSGAFIRRGDSLVITTRVTDQTQRRVLASLDAFTTPVSDPLLHANALRDRISGALAAAFDQRITSITLPSSRPPNFPAYQEFVLGLETFQKDENAAIPYFERASSLDTTFALPLIWATFAHKNAGREDQADSVVRLLIQRRPPPGSLEELQLREFLARDAEEILRLQLEGAARSPGSTWSHNAGRELHDRNRMREAIRSFEQVDPEHGWARDWVVYWLYYTRALHGIAEYEKELQVTRRALSLQPDNAHIQILEIRALAAARRETELRSRLGALLSGLAGKSCPRAADLYQQTALELAAHADTGDASAVVRAWVSGCEADVRNLAPTAPDSARTVRLAWLGTALYRAGQLDSARHVLRDALGSVRHLTSDGYLVETMVRGVLGRIAARRGDRAGATRAMQLLRGHGGHTDYEYAAIASLLGESEEATRHLAALAARPVLSYYRFHRDPDYAHLWTYPPFAALMALK